MGWVADRFGGYRPAAVAGLAATLAGLMVGTWQPYAAMVLVGVGNALFHVGAGAIVLRQWVGRATGPGIFVAPGALGLAVGVQQGLAGFPYRWAIASALIAAAAAVAFARTARVGLAAPLRRATPRLTALLAAGVVLLLFSSGIRALAGTGLADPWRSVPTVAWLLTAAAVAGKALGGIAADKLGWRIVPVAALALMAVCAHWGSGEVSLTVASVLLLQTTMAVTLAAVAAAMPNRPAVAFGLPSLALLLGDLLSALDVLSPNVVVAAVPLLGLGAALMIYVGLSCLGLGTPCK